MKKRAVVFCVFALLGLSQAPLRAQDKGDEDLRKAVDGALEEAKKNPLQEKAAKRAKLRDALKETLDALNRGQAGKSVADYIADMKNGVGIGFMTQDSTSTVEVGCFGGAVIRLSDALPPYPRALAPQIVDCACYLLLPNMHGSAEERYMYVSLQARSWLELGGDKDLLPMIEPLAGYQDEAFAADFKRWFENKPADAILAIAKATGAETLSAKHPTATEWKGNCGVAQASHRVITTAEEWEKFWKEAGEVAPAADLSKNFAVGVFLGSRPSAGFRAVFSEPAAGKGATIVRYKVEGPNGAAALAITQPYAVRLFPKTGQPVQVEAAAD